MVVMVVGVGVTVGVGVGDGIFEGSCVKGWVASAMSFWSMFSLFFRESGRGVLLILGLSMMTHAEDGFVRGFHALEMQGLEVGALCWVCLAE